MLLFVLLLQDSQKVWQKPGIHREVQPQHKVPVHPGADDDTDSEEEQERVRMSANSEVDNSERMDDKNEKSDSDGSDHDAND